MRRLWGGLLLCLLFYFASPPPVAAMSRKNEIQREILALYATMDLLVSAAEEALKSVRPGYHLYDGSNYEQVLRITVHLATGDSGTGFASHEVARRVSKVTNWDIWFLKWGPRRNGKTEAEKAVRQLAWYPIVEAGVQAGRDIYSSRAGARETAMATATTVWKLVSAMQEDLRAAVNAQISYDLLAEALDCEQLLQTLRGPIDSYPFRLAMPEVRVFYINSVNYIEHLMLNYCL